MLKYSILLILLFTSFMSHAQLTGRERADSIKEANQTRIELIKEANARRIDSIKQINQARRDSLALVKEARAEKAKQRNKDAKNKEPEEFVQDDNLSKKEQLAVRKDSMANERAIASEKRKQENLAKQNSRLKNRKPIEKPISQEISFGYRLASDGWGLFATRGFIKTEDPEKIHTLFFWLDLSEKKNPKETQSTNQNFVLANPNEIKPVSYKYGKINNFYTFKLGIANAKPLSGLLDKKSIAISWTYQAGISFGILKPYYLDLLIPEGSGFVRKYAKYDESIEESFLDLKNQGTIIGGSSFDKGLNEIKLQPGFVLRSGFLFDHSLMKNSYFGVEIGASIEAYTQKIPIMINTENKALFFNIYADVRFGNRWK